MKRKPNAAAWTYDHRAGLCITIIVYLLLAIAFMGQKIVVHGRTPNNAFLVDMQTLEELIKEQQRLEQEVKMRQQSEVYEQVLNRISNENAQQAEQQNSSLSGDEARQVEQINQALAEKMRANKELYDEGMREIDEMWNERNRNKDNDGQKNTDSKVAGTVTVAYSLINPLRHSVKLYVPAYRCENGGKVVVNITVNRNGDVTSASVDKSASSSDACMQETAVDAARRSRFDINTSAPERHAGTITYIFIPQ